MNDLKNFALESASNIQKMALDPKVRSASQHWIDVTGPHKFAYNWRWLGLPIIQLPMDIVATQEIVWSVRPQVIIETGIARGGSVVFNAAQLAMLDLCGEGKATLADSRRRCIGIDVEIRKHNREAIESHPLSPMIKLIEGSSVEDSVINAVKKMIRPDDKVLVILDSNHTHEHVKLELEKYSPIVSVGSYLIVHDTGIEYAADGAFSNKSWGKGNNPLSAVREFLVSNRDFEIDRHICGKLQITSSPDGYLRRLS